MSSFDKRLPDPDQDEQPKRNNHRCKANGCPLAGTNSHDVGKTDNYFCRFHFAASDPKAWVGITQRIRQVLKDYGIDNKGKFLYVFGSEVEYRIATARDALAPKYDAPFVAQVSDYIRGRQDNTPDTDGVVVSPKDKIRGEGGLVSAADYLGAA